MKNIIRIFSITSGLLVAFVLMTPSSYAAVNNGGLSGSCNTITDCGPTQDFYDGQCQDHIETTNDCNIGGWTNISFSCNSGCQGSCGSGEVRCGGVCQTAKVDDGDVAPGDGIVDGLTCAAAGFGFSQCTGQCTSGCTGGKVVVNGKCLSPLQVLDDAVDADSVGNSAYKIWDNSDLTEVVHLNTAGCADDEVAISDASEDTGWKCGAAGSSLWTENSSDIYFDTGNVGIGTTSPGAALHVETGNAEGGSAIFGSGGTTAAGDFAVAMGSGSTASGKSSIAGGTLSTASAEGTVAIGANATASGLLSRSLGSLTTASGHYSTAMGVGTTAQAAFSAAFGRYNVFSGSTTTWSGSDPLFVIGNGTADLSRANALTVLKNGKVGIGVTDPAEMLDVNGNVQTSNSFIGVGGHGANYAHFSHKNFKGFGQYALLQSTGGNTYLNSVGAGNLYFRNDNSTQMFIADTGEVGIGTTSPTAKLNAVNGAYNAALVQPSVFGVIGVSGYGEAIGGYFDNDTGVSYAIAASGDVGLVGAGNERGGHFLDNNESGLAYVADSHYGIKAYGDSAGGFFQDSNSNVYAYTGFSTYSLYGNGRLYLADSGCGGGCRLGTFSGASGNYVRVFGDGWLDITGNGQKPGGGSWGTLSDARLKDVDGAYEGGLDEILALKPVSYQYKMNNEYNYDSSIGYVGLIAQDVQSVFPATVSEDEKGYLQLDTTEIDYAVINAIQELKAENDALRDVVCELKPDAEVCSQ